MKAEHEKYLQLEKDIEFLQRQVSKKLSELVGIDDYKITAYLDEVDSISVCYESREARYGSVESVDFNIDATYEEVANDIRSFILAKKGRINESRNN